MLLVSRNNVDELFNYDGTYYECNLRVMLIVFFMINNIFYYLLKFDLNLVAATKNYA